MRFGQNAVNAAAPTLEQSVDRQLTAFVNANISDTIRDSRAFLTTALDQQVLSDVAAEVLHSNADVTVADATRLLPAEAVAELVRAAFQVWLELRATPTRPWCVRWWRTSSRCRASGPWPTLADAGLTEEIVTELAVAVVGPAVAVADSDGYLGERIRARLAPFYASYDPSAGGEATRV